jgi:hypothetical protein
METHEQFILWAGGAIKKLKDMGKEFKRLRKDRKALAKSIGKIQKKYGAWI